MRELKGYSQEVLATNLGMSQANYCKLENGETELKVKTLQKIADFLKVEISSLFAEPCSVNSQNSSIAAFEDLVKLCDENIRNVDVNLLIRLIKSQMDSIQSKNIIVSLQEQELSRYREEINLLKAEIDSLKTLVEK